MSEVITTPIESTPIDLPAILEPSKVMEEAPVESLVTATPVVVETEAVAPVLEEEAPVAAPAVHKRSPFTDLKNKLLGPSKPAAAVVPASEDVKETIIVPEVTPKENEVPAEVVAEEAAPAVVEEEVKDTPKKAKSPGVFEKVKAYFDSPKTPKVKKEKAPKVEEAAVAAVAPEATEDAAPVVEAAVVPVEPVVPVVEESVKETEHPVASTSEVVAPAAVDESAAKVDAADKPAKKEMDLVKLGRRISARFGAALSPKKEKKDPIGAVESHGVEAAAATEESTAVAAVAEEPTVAHVAAIEEAPKVEHAPAVEPVSAVAETAHEETKAVEVPAVTA